MIYDPALKTPFYLIYLSLAHFDGKQMFYGGKGAALNKYIDGIGHEEAQQAERFFDSNHDRLCCSRDLNPGPIEPTYGPFPRSSITSTLKRTNGIVFILPFFKSC